MGQKVNPIGFRLGVIRGWDSNWYDGKVVRGSKLVEDEEIRRYLDARLKRAGLSRTVIERTPKRVILTLHTSRPGVIIGRGGTEVEKLREELKQLTSKDIQININEIKRPELDASLVAQNIAQQLEGRVSYRRAMKQALGAAMRMGAQGIRIRLAGRLGGSEMGRVEQYLEGRVPLHTMRADIDYAQATAKTHSGHRRRESLDLPRRGDRQARPQPERDRAAPAGCRPERPRASPSRRPRWRWNGTDRGGGGGRRPPIALSPSLLDRPNCHVDAEADQVPQDAEGPRQGASPSAAPASRLATTGSRRSTPAGSRPARSRPLVSP